MRSGTRWWGVLFWSVLAWSTVALGEEPSGPRDIQGYTVPGRNPDSATPWEFFLGHAAHRLIAYMYGVNHPNNTVYYNTKSIETIVDETGLGDVARLLPGERHLRPDITDVTHTSTLCVFEIKPWGEQGLLDGNRAVQTYLTALNRAVTPRARFLGGTEFQGEILIRFAQGQYIWRLEWRTSEPGVVQYQWSRSQQRFESEAAAYEARQWIDLTEQELRQYGGWVGQAVDGLVDRRERLATFSGAVGIVIELAGSAATGFFSSMVLGHGGSEPSARQPPAQGGRVIPFPGRPPPADPSVRLPATGSMSHSP
jgi:hypothetical protein